jgi:hypothetical protein
MPNAIGPDDEHLLTRVQALRERAGRPLVITWNNSSTKPSRLARLAEAGVDRVLFYLPAASGDALEARLERIESGLEGAGLR